MCCRSSGDDRYNIDEGYTVAQYQGAARDGCLGIFIDGYGNDLYFFRKRCGGSGDLNSIGFFWDRFGDDVYDSLSVSMTFGASSIYEPHENMRDEIMTVGIFLDSDGHDLYNIDPYADDENKPECADNKEWHHNSGPVFWGYGLDTDWYSSQE